MEIFFAGAKSGNNDLGFVLSRVKEEVHEDDDGGTCGELRVVTTDFSEF